MSAIDDAVAAAKAAKAAAEAATSNTAVAHVHGGAVAAPAAPAAKLNMDTVSAGQMAVDAWIKVKEFGLLIGDSSILFQDCLCSIDMTDGSGFVVKKAIKAGNPAQYWYTTDGVTCSQGGSWDAAVQKAKSMDPKAYEYRCVDLPFTLLEDIKVKEKGGEKVLATAGQKLGHTTSTTNWKNWEAFFGECKDKELLKEPVVVRLTAEPRNNGTNKWGVIAFELVGSMAEAGGE